MSLFLPPGLDRRRRFRATVLKPDSRAEPYRKPQCIKRLDERIFDSRRFTTRIYTRRYGGEPTNDETCSRQTKHCRLVLFGDNNGLLMKEAGIHLKRGIHA